MNYKPILAITAIFLIGCLLNIESLKAENPSQEKIQKAINFLLTTKARFQSATSFAINKLNDICKDKSLEKLWEEKREEDIPADMKILYQLYTPTPEPLNPAELEKVTEMDRILIKAYYCQDFSFKDILHDIEQIKKDGGMISSHILYYLAIIKEKGCYSKELLDPLIKNLVDELTVIQDNKGKQKDISLMATDNESMLAYAERALFIGYAGYPVKNVWIKNILKCQLPDGSWIHDTHTTAVCLWAIVQKKGYCK